MIKKIILSLFSFLVVFILNTKTASAICRPWVPSQCAAVRCDVNGEWNCCDTTSECTQLTGTPMQNNPGGSVYNPSNTSGQSDVLCPENKNGINTAIGCLNVLGGQDQFLGAILKWAVGIGGGIAFLLILYSGFMIMSAAGSPDRLKAGQELLTSALSGLILLIFSLFILKFIGIDILGLGDFGFGKSP